MKGQTTLATYTAGLLRRQHPQHPARARRRRHPATGMTLVELMVGMAVGLFVATVAIATFVSTRGLNLVNASTTRMSENARLAMDLLHTDLRGSGFAGCWPLGQRQDDPPLSTLQAGAGDGFITEGMSGLRGYKGVAGTFSPALPAALTGLAKPPLAGSDVVSVRVPADNTAMGVVAAMATPDAAPQVAPATPGNAIVQGDIVLIANCESAAIFQVTEADPAATGVLTHAAGGGAARSNSSTSLQKTYRSDATVYRLETRHYYVADSVVRPGTRSLWRLEVSGALKPGGGLKAVEVASGIDRIEVSYGVDAIAATGATPKNVTRYVDAAGVADWDRVLSARVQMVAATPEDNMARVQAASAPDRRLRTALTEVVTLRNGAP